ncbi:MAG: hypothetical protein IK078_12075 [Lachnospiraceae bacterium]|nr:hypothetical protein [Lachnospiraceae bacterium]
MKKLAVMFPGIGYTTDRPLLYYASKLAAKYGYESVRLDFRNIKGGKEALKNPEKLQTLLGQGIDTAMAGLAETDFSEYGDIIFISKSYGTVIAAAIAKQQGIPAKQVYLTPIASFADFVQEGNGIAFFGTADPFANADEIERICKEKGLKWHRVPDANHSLETEDVYRNIEVLKEVLREVEKLITA